MRCNYFQASYQRLLSSAYSRSSGPLWEN